MDTERLVASNLSTSYGAAIELEQSLLASRLPALAREVQEVRHLIWAELLSLYINTAEQMTRDFLGSLGIGDSLLEDARSILRSEGERRRLEALLPYREQAAEVSQDRLAESVRPSVAKVSAGRLQLFRGSPTGDAKVTYVATGNEDVVVSG